MTVSGSTDFSVTRNDIIISALKTCGALSEEETASAIMVSDASFSLNMLIKSWQAKSIGLWLHQEVDLALAYQTQSYDLGPSGSHCSASMVHTTIDTAADSGDGSIVVESATGINNGDYIGIELDDGTMQWTTVNGAPAATTVTLTATLTDDAASGNVVRVYTTKISRPLRIVRNTVRIIDTSGNETDLIDVSESDYKILTMKSSLGTASQYYYDPILTNGKFYTWPTCDDVSKFIRMVIERPVYDFDAYNDTPDFPQEWFRCLKWNLAQEIGPDYDVPELRPRKWETIIGMATSSLADVEAFDRENTSVYFQPDT